jgi:D-alanyl-D-alanine carboxypeptidase
MRWLLVGLTAAAVVSAVAIIAVSAYSGRESDNFAAPTSTPPTSVPVAPMPSEASVQPFDKTRLSIDDPASIWVVSDKLRPLVPADYVPADLVAVPVPYVNAPELRAEASAAVVAMFAEFQAETGLQMQSQSAYRSYSTQVKVYNGWVAKLGQAQADIQSARPGFSEHQTGLALDISALPAKCSLDACFADTPQGQWLAANAWKFGYLLRYPADKTAITGFTFEPWHYRYIGVELATEMHDTGVTTLEEFFGLPAAPDYAP